jgi:hypothetical protein
MYLIEFALSWLYAANKKIGSACYNFLWLWLDLAFQASAGSIRLYRRMLPAKQKMSYHILSVKLHGPNIVHLLSLQDTLQNSDSDIWIEVEYDWMDGHRYKYAFAPTKYDVPIQDILEDIFQELTAEYMKQLQCQSITVQECEDRIISKRYSMRWLSKGIIAHIDVTGVLMPWAGPLGNFYQPERHLRMKYVYRDLEPYGFCTDVWLRSGPNTVQMHVEKEDIIKL